VAVGHEWLREALAAQCEELTCTDLRADESP